MHLQLNVRKINRENKVIPVKSLIYKFAVGRERKLPQNINANGG